MEQTQEIGFAATSASQFDYSVLIFSVIGFVIYKIFENKMGFEKLNSIMMSITIIFCGILTFNIYTTDTYELSAIPLVGWIFIGAILSYLYERDKLKKS